MDLFSPGVFSFCFHFLRYYSEQEQYKYVALRLLMGCGLKISPNIQGQCLISGFHIFEVQVQL